MLHKSTTIIVGIVGRVMVPFIQLFALYVITHGHFSPGGGFQGGALLGASLILLRFSIGVRLSKKVFSLRLGTPLSGVGVFMYAFVGVLAIFGGGLYLDYVQLPIPGISGPSLRSFGIFLVELGVGIGVMGAMIAIFDDLTRTTHDE